jgi:Cu+-exporting ATPase
MAGPVTRSLQSAQLDLDIGGMTCASCAMRIEKRLNRLDGVRASVNYATSKASITHPAGLGTDELVAAVEKAGYSASVPPPRGSRSAEEGDGATRRRLLLSAVLTAPVVAMAMVPSLQLDGWQWVSLALATPVVAYGGWPFHRSAWTNLRHGATSMDTLVSMGTLAAYGWSVYALFWGAAGEIGMTHSFDFTVQQHGTSTIYLEAAAGVTTFLLLGRWAEERSKARAGAALQALLELGAKDVTVVRDGVQQRIPVDQLAVGDVFVVRPGEQVATDGVVVTGRSAIDASLLTGESVPVEVAPGDLVTGATINTSGHLQVGATRIGSDTSLAQLARLVEEAQNGKAQVQRLADRVSSVFVPVVLLVALATLAAWIALDAGGLAGSTAAVAVLIIACPCALGLATPTALLVGSGRGAQLGIVIRGPQVLESTRRVDTVVLDKTGTVTTGQMSLHEVHAGDGVDPMMLVRLAGAVEAASQHPVAMAVADAATERCGELPAVDRFASLDGLGVRGEVEGHDVVVGRRQALADAGMTVSPQLERALEREQAQGRTAVLAGWDGAVRGVLAVSDTVRPTSAEAVRRLRDLGLAPMLLTGDTRAVAERVAADVGIDEVVAEVPPADKAAAIRSLQARGRTVAMIGDGVNDAAALAQADLGMAMGTGTDVAIAASDLTLVRSDLRVAADAIRLARRTLATIKGNLFWAFAYNVVGIPLAAAGLLSPMIAGAAMALSSVFVVTNSLRLRRFSPLSP